MSKPMRYAPIQEPAAVATHCGIYRDKKWAHFWSCGPASQPWAPLVYIYIHYHYINPLQIITVYIYIPGEIGNQLVILHRPTFTGLAAVLITWLPVDWENWWKFNGISTVINMWMEYLLTTQNGWFHGYVDHLDYKSWVPPKNWNLMSLGANYGHGHWVSSGFLQILGSVLWNPS
jgi:hypothetical protein